MNANVSPPPVGLVLRNTLIATLLVVVGGGAGFAVLSSGEDKAPDPPAEPRQAEPRIPHVASSSEWAPPVSDEGSASKEP